jgi:hypothetical protein
MNRERTDIVDPLDPARFARQHRELDAALRAQLKPPVMDAAFRAQVRARVAAAKAAAVRPVPAPLRSGLWLQLANVLGGGVAAALVSVALAAQLGGTIELDAAALGPPLRGPVGVLIGGAITLASVVYALRQLPPWRQMTI